MLSVNSLLVHCIVRNGEITELLATLKVPYLFLRPRHGFVWWSTLKWVPHYTAVRSGLMLVCRATRNLKSGGGGHVICHYFMRRDVYLMLSIFCRCMGITCNTWGRAQDPTQLPHKFRGDGSRACFRLSGLALAVIVWRLRWRLGQLWHHILSSAQGRTFTFWVSWHEFQSYRAWHSAPAGAADSWCVYRCARYCTQLRNHRTLGHTEIAELVFAP